MSNFLLIFLCLGLGVLLKRTGRFPHQTSQVLNSFVTHVSLPALILVQIPELIRNTELSYQMLIPVSMAWLVFLMSWALFGYLGKTLRWSKAETGALILTAGLGNTSFVGFPLLEAFYGSGAISVGIVADQLGSFLVLSSLGLFVAAKYSDKNPNGFSMASTVLHIVRFPPFISLVVAVLWFTFGTPGTEIMTPVFQKLASTLVPLALIAVGFQLHLSRGLISRQAKPLAWGLSYKLVLAPLILMGLYVGVFASHTLSTQITLLEAAMAPMITASVIAIEFGLKAEIANLMVGLGIPLSLLTVSVWYKLLEIIV